MEFFKRIFHRKREQKDGQKPRPLRIDGCKTTLTPTPDDAELAAQALLETMAAHSEESRNDDKTTNRLNDRAANRLNDKKESSTHDAAYYRELSKKIKTARAAEKRHAMRYLAYAEQQLESPLFTDNTSLNELEQELYRLQDIAEREGGELLRRWQHCLAECIVRQMRAAANTANDMKEKTGNAGESGGPALDAGGSADERGGSAVTDELNNRNE